MQLFADKKFSNPVEQIAAFSSEQFRAAFKKIEKYRKTHYLLGYIRYEAKDVFLGKSIESEKPLLYFEVFSGYEEFKPSEIKDFTLQKEPMISYDEYSWAIKKIKDEIVEGNTYEVNYTYNWKVDSDLSGFDLYQALLGRQKTPYNAYLKNNWDEILSFSPELFFELEDNKIKTKPMKGTVKRGESEEEDIKNIEFLRTDVKNRAENVMIVDLLRNDLGRIAETGTVKVDKLFEIETHKTLHQMTSEVSAELKENTTLWDIFEAIFPCGSITGAPKISTMEIIEKIEQGKREIYCGAIGLISPQKTVFSVPIRILQRAINDKSYIYRVGGAIVWDSTSEEEWEESITKTSFLQSDFKLVETMLVKNGKIKFEKEHFARMKKSTKELGFGLGFEFNTNNIKKEIGLSLRPLREKLGEARMRGFSESKILRLLLSKKGSIETQILPLEEIKTNKITISKKIIDSKEKLLYHKTTFRPWYKEAMEKIKRGEIFDEIFFNEKGELTEGARSNLVLQINGKLYTPPVSCGLLDGVFRQNMMKKLQEKILYLEDFKNAEKIFCINSVRGVVEVELI